jgi:uncharacterized protein YllA (UPF0747 family)
MPTVAYLGGPGEVAYFAQVSAVAEALGVPTPLVLPRWSMTIIEPRIQRILNDLGVDAAAFADPHAVEGRAARERVPADAVSAQASLRRDLNAGLDALQRSGADLSAAVIEGLRRSIQHRLERLDRRIVAAAKRRETGVMQSVTKARGSLFPGGIRQERQLAYVPFLARYGHGLIQQMLEAARVHTRTLVAGGPALTAPTPAATASV